MKNIYLYLLLIISFSSCIEDYDLKIEDYTPKYTIDAIISNDVYYSYVRISKVNPGFSSKNTLVSGWELLPKEIGVEDAVVFIYDSENKAFEFKKPVNPIPNDSGDTNYDPYDHFKYGYGYYKAPKDFVFKVGEEYRMEVVVGNEKYTARGSAKDTPEITKIDVRKQTLEIQKEDVYVPFISFTDLEIDDTNYYITQLFTIDDQYNSVEKSNSSSRVWGYSIFEDSLLKTNVEDFMVSFGTAPDHGSWYPEWNERILVDMMSVDKYTYDYFKTIISQIKNGGGLYSQTPASPVTNIKGGALGYFMVCDISTILSKK